MATVRIRPDVAAVMATFWAVSPRDTDFVSARRRPVGWPLLGRGAIAGADARRLPGAACFDKIYLSHMPAKLAVGFE
ncbi:hypothetical protein GCM10017708_17430 [Arthrobacter citreus]